MIKLIVGAICVVIGVVGLATNFSEFIGLLMGSIPVILIFAGILVIYLNYDNDSPDDETCEASGSEPTETEPYKTEPAHIVESVDVDPPNFVGNSSSLVFHNPDCKFATNIKNEVKFQTKEEAIEQKYKPCGICKP